MGEKVIRIHRTKHTYPSHYCLLSPTVFTPTTNCLRPPGASGGSYDCTYLVTNLLKHTSRRCYAQKSATAFEFRKQTDAFKMHHEGRASQRSVLLFPQLAGIWKSQQSVFQHQNKKWMSLQVLVLSYVLSLSGEGRGEREKGKGGEGGEGKRGGFVSCLALYCVLSLYAP